MQEVLEKIIAKLGIRAEKSEKKEMDAEYFEYAQMYKGERIAFGDAIEIVKQEAEKYNNGWIPCSERLPEEHDSMFARFKGTDKWRDSMFEKTSNEVAVTIADEKGEKATTHAHTTDGTWKCDILRACPTYRVIAWQPLPAPYQPTRENCSNRHENGNCLAVGGFCTSVDDKYCKYHKKKTNFDMCCESMDAMAQIIDTAKIGWTKEQIMEWLQKEECEVPE